VAGSCECDNETSGFIAGRGVFLDKLVTSCSVIPFSMTLLRGISLKLLTEG